MNLQEETAPLNQPSQEEILKQRRRQRILARSQQSQVPPQISENKETEVRTGTIEVEKTKRISVFDMLKTDIKHKKWKSQLQIISIVLGAMVAVIFSFSICSCTCSEIAFVCSLVLIIVGTIFLERYKKTVSKEFQESNKTEFDPLISQVTKNLKNVQILNQILNFRESLSPLNKFLSSFFLSLLLITNINSGFNLNSS